MKPNGHMLPLGVAVVLALAIWGGAVVFGEQKTKIEDHERRIQSVEETQKKIHEIDKKQAVLMNDVKNMAREQKTYQNATTKTLDLINRKLDQ